MKKGKRHAYFFLVFAILIPGVQGCPSYAHVFRAPDADYILLE